MDLVACDEMVAKHLNETLFDGLFEPIGDVLETVNVVMLVHRDNQEILERMNSHI